MIDSRVTVVLPAHNAETTLRRQLRALDQQDAPFGFDVIVVDNASTDGTADLARRMEPATYLIRVVSERRKGINYARNAGVAATPGGLVAMCDADDEVESGWLRGLVSVMEPGSFAGGGYIGYTELNDSRLLRRFGYADEWRSPEVPDPSQAPCGCSCAFWKEMWDEIGGFDSRLSGVGDDTEFFLRAISTGWQLRWAPSARLNKRIRLGVVPVLRKSFSVGEHRPRYAQTQGRVRVLRVEFLRLLWALRGAAAVLVPERRWTWIRSVAEQAGCVYALLPPASRAS